MALFEKRTVKLNSGEVSDFKIECDALTDEDLECIAYLMSKKLKFKAVYGVPTGGKRLEGKLRQYCIDDNSLPILVCDDVLTTGGSINRFKSFLNKIDGKSNIITAVIFNRGYKGNDVFSLFTMQLEGEPYVNRLSEIVGAFPDLYEEPNSTQPKGNNISEQQIRDFFEEYIYGSGWSMEQKEEATKQIYDWLQSLSTPQGEGLDALTSRPSKPTFEMNHAERITHIASRTVSEPQPDPTLGGILMAKKWVEDEKSAQPTDDREEEILAIKREYNLLYETSVGNERRFKQRISQLEKEKEGKKDIGIATHVHVEVLEDLRKAQQKISQLEELLKSRLPDAKRQRKQK
jgi:hypoxanthine phosphoribosyltransferase